MYKDVISYELTEGTTREKLLDVAKRIYKDWMAKQKGFIKWEIHSNKDGSYTDIVYWESEEAAKEAEKDMINIPYAGEWFSCYKEGTTHSLNLTALETFSG